MTLGRRMGNDTSSVQAASEDSQLPSATKANANTPAGACPTCSPHIAKKSIAGGKGSWEFRFFALVSPGGKGGSDGSGTLDDALSRAHGVTGVDLSSKSKCGMIQCFVELLLLSSSWC